jgi:hypothetical protein
MRRLEYNYFVTIVERALVSIISFLDCRKCVLLCFFANVAENIIIKMFCSDDNEKVKWHEKVQLKLQVYIVFYFHYFHFIDLYIIFIYSVTVALVLIISLYRY